ncbi:hypothetical protein KM043_013164 [Ampulex compressa]|nr:hypothetical protein KM043_013164 [Ampulex compressa]
MWMESDYPDRILRAAVAMCDVGCRGEARTTEFKVKHIEVNLTSSRIRGEEEGSSVVWNPWMDFHEARYLEWLPSRPREKYGTTRIRSPRKFARMFPPSLAAAGR